MATNRHSWVYIMASRKNGTLYVGVSSDLRQRVWQHKAQVSGGFTSKYHVTTLVHFEQFSGIRHAIAREKAIKGWTRVRKIALIETTNADWCDLARNWFERGLDSSPAFAGSE